jgi:hypothetical protein
MNTAERVSQSPAKFTTVTIYLARGTDDSPTVNFAEFDGTDKLTEVLSTEPDPLTRCRLFIVENVCPGTIALLGGHFDIDTQFFADYLTNVSWYRIENVLERIPALPSNQKTHDFQQIRHLDFRTIDRISRNASESPSDIAKVISTGRFYRVSDPLSDGKSYKSFTYPDSTTTRIQRKAGKLLPRSRKGKEFKPILCTRQVTLIWFQKRKPGDEGWTGTICFIQDILLKLTSISGVLLVDPPFQLPRGNHYCLPSEIRSFMPRPSLKKPPTEGIYSHSSIREAFVYHLERRFNKDPLVLKVAMQDAFFILGDIYRLIASRWMVANEYLNRELATIDHMLEKEEPDIQELEAQLKDLYVYRRRSLMYHKLISELKDQCQRRGQPNWSRDVASDIAIKHAADLEEDFAFLQLKMQETEERIEKTLNHLTSLVVIGESKQGIRENQGVARITLVAMIFLPFSTVAGILGMQGNFAPGADGFWIFWVIAIPLTALITGLFVLHDNFGVVVRYLSYFCSQCFKISLGDSEKTSTQKKPRQGGSNFGQSPGDTQAPKELPTVVDAV